MLQWQNGWIVGVTIRTLYSAPALALLLGAPIARFLSRIDVEGNDPRAITTALKDSPWRHRIRELVALQPHASLFVPKVLPALERATLRQVAGHPTLRELVLEPVVATDLSAHNLPALEHLTLRCGKIRERALIEMIEATPFEKLRSLKRVDLDGDISARTLARIRDRLSAFIG